MKKLAIIVLFLSPFLVKGQAAARSRYTTVTARQVIQVVIEHTGSEPIPNTVDIIKEGDPETPVKGISTCMFATMDVLKQAVDKGCNLIITHEPIYYNHMDETFQLQNDPVFLEKKKYIEEHKLVIWRFHDYLHSMRPDGILSGMVQQLGWKQYATNDHLDQFVFPETTLKAFLENLKKTFPTYTFSIAGKPEMKLSRVRLAPGAPGTSLHIQLLEDNNTDLVITGECEQWETYEYTRDAVAQGRNKAVIFLGHIPSEESGMQFCAQWLRGIIPNIPVTYIPCGSSYWSF